MPQCGHSHFDVSREKDWTQSAREFIRRPTEKLVDMISAHEELQKARTADVARGPAKAEELHGMLSEHTDLGDKHEKLSQMRAEQERGTLKNQGATQRHERLTGAAHESAHRRFGTRAF